jgi:hypothetical protein
MLADKTGLIDLVANPINEPKLRRFGIFIVYLLRISSKNI